MPVDFSKADPKKLEGAFFEVMQHMAGAAALPLVFVGDRLGLFSAIVEEGPISAADLAEKTGLFPRYIQEWIATMAAAQYVEYDPETEKFHMTPEQAVLFAGEGHPMCAQGMVESIHAIFWDQPKLEDAFKTGEGIPWGAHSPSCFCGTDRFFRPVYNALLTRKWIPALEGVEARLDEGGLVADIACGHGGSTLLMAKRFPQAEIVGYDFHEPSVEKARKKAEEQGLKNVRFEVARAQDFPGKDYDLITVFDALHDMGDPVGAATHIRQAIKADGTLMIVEPFANDKLEDNLNLQGKMLYAFSTQICVPASRAQEVGAMLGAQAGEARMRGVVNEGGFSHFRRASETRFNIVYEARP